MASSASQRRTVDADTVTARPSATACAASSAELHRDRGTARAAGGSHAIALTSATTCAGNDLGRPDLLRVRYRPLVDLVARWWNGERDRLARRDIWLTSDGQRWAVRARHGAADDREVRQEFTREYEARAMVDR